MTLELDDRLDRFEIGFPIYKEFNKVEHKGKIIGYDSKHRLYEVEYMKMAIKKNFITTKFMLTKIASRLPLPSQNNHPNLSVLILVKQKRNII